MSISSLKNDHEWFENCIRYSPIKVLPRKRQYKVKLSIAPIALNEKSYLTILECKKLETTHPNRRHTQTHTHTHDTRHTHTWAMKAEFKNRRCKRCPFGKRRITKVLLATFSSGSGSSEVACVSCQNIKRLTESTSEEERYYEWVNGGWAAVTVWLCNCVWLLRVCACCLWVLNLRVCESAACECSEWMSGWGCATVSAQYYSTRNK